MARNGDRCPLLGLSLPSADSVRLGDAARISRPAQRNDPSGFAPFASSARVSSSLPAARSPTLSSRFICPVLSGHATRRPKSPLTGRQQKLGVLKGEFSAVPEFVQPVLPGLWKAAGVLILNTLRLQIVGKYSCRNGARKRSPAGGRSGRARELWQRRREESCETRVVEEGGFCLVDLQ